MGTMAILALVPDKNITWDHDILMYNTSSVGQGSISAANFFKTLSDGTRESGSSNWVFVWYDGSFQMQDDYEILSIRESYLGGLFHSTSDKVIHVPHALTYQDMVDISHYMFL